MTREIKFRAWDKLGKRMFTNRDYSFVFSDGFLKSLVDRIEGTQLTLVEPKVVVMQFTGMKDKNMIDIYEGDVVRGNFTPSGFFTDEDGNVIYKNLEVYFSQGTFMTDYEMLPIYPEDVEVVGNIYQNPELLKVSDA